MAIEQGSRPGWIIHINMDAFYAAVEQRDHPAYPGCPVSS